MSLRVTTPVEPLPLSEAWAKTDDELDTQIIEGIAAAATVTVTVAAALHVRKERGTWKETHKSWGAFVADRYGVTRVTAWRRLLAFRAALAEPDKPAPSQRQAIRARSVTRVTLPIGGIVREPGDTQAGEAQPPPDAAVAGHGDRAREGRGTSLSPAEPTSPRGAPVPAPEPDIVGLLKTEVVTLNAENHELRKERDEWRAKAERRLGPAERDARLANVLLDAAEAGLEGQLIAEMYGDRETKRRVAKWLRRFAKRFDEACTVAGKDSLHVVTD